MKAWDYDAAVVGSEVFCIGCLPDPLDAAHPDVQPIFASDEWDVYPVCHKCGREHDYVGLTTEGRLRENPLADPLITL